MKTIKNLVITGLGMIGLAACQTKSSSTIEGTYVIAYQQEYAKGNDTLIVTSYNKEGNTYKIERHTGYNPIREGKLLPRKLEQEEWMASYNTDKMILQQTEFGKQVYVNNQAKTVSFGGTYHKIK